jgi:hypothetical protein
MPLDFTLIDNSTVYSLDKLTSKTSTISPNLFLLDSFLHPQLLAKLNDYILNTKLDWHIDPYQATKNRLKINWVADTVIEEVHIVMENLTTALNQHFNRSNKFLGITIWKDQEGYTIERHRDRALIDLAIQIYLFGGTDDLGTKFEYNNTIISADYKENSGYLQDNQTGVVHYLDNPVPKDHIRYSLYVIWTRD